jgi:hypothetical protein
VNKAFSYGGDYITLLSHGTCLTEHYFDVIRVAGFFEIVLCEILVLNFHIFNLKIDFWSFLTLSFNCLVVFRNTG